MLVRKATKPKRTCRIALVGKYIAIRDAYKSLYEALQHAGMASNCKVDVVPVEAEEFEKKMCHAGKRRCEEHENLRASASPREIEDIDGILVPGGFGSRGVEGKIAAIKYARENNIPFLGICLGMQCTVIEYARDALGWKDANSTEFDENTTHPVIDLMEEQRGVTQKGGTMRLGAYPCVLKKGTLAAKLYKKVLTGSTRFAGLSGGIPQTPTPVNPVNPVKQNNAAGVISERHRHRYEMAMRSDGALAVEKAGLCVSGISPDGKLAEIVELPQSKHPYFIASQFHPEFKSRPTAPHPLFVGLVSAALKRTHAVHKPERQRR